MFAQNIIFWLQIAALAFFGTLAVSGFMRAAGLGDAADGRSSHRGVVPTAGGVGLIAGLGLALCGIALLFPGLDISPKFTPVVSLVFAVGFLGLIDDVLTLGPKFKFSLMILMCAAAVWVIGPPNNLPGVSTAIPLPRAIAFAGAVLWVFVVMNAVNFMDGANGMMVLTLAIANFALFGVGLIGGSATTLILSGLSLMIILGFAPYNLRRDAKIFAGDVGALSLGFLFAVTVLILISETPERRLHLIGPALLLPFLTDILLTLVRRLRNRENLLQSHRSHLYQRLIQRGHGHLSVSWYYALGALICANIVVVGAARDWFDTLQIFAAMVGGAVMLYLLVSRRLADPRDDKSS